MIKISLTKEIKELRNREKDGIITLRINSNFSECNAMKLGITHILVTRIQRKVMGCAIMRLIKHHPSKPLTLILTFVTCLCDNKSTKTVQIHCCYYQKHWFVGFKGTNGMWILRNHNYRRTTPNAEMQKEKSFTVIRNWGLKGKRLPDSISKNISLTESDIHIIALPQGINGFCFWLVRFHLRSLIRSNGRSTGTYY